MENKLKLKDDQINYLSSLPEQGMGYQIVDIVLKNGLILQNRIVLNSSLLIINNNENINVDDIDKISLHLNK